MRRGVVLVEMSFNVEENKTRFPSRTTRSKGASDESFSMTSWFKAVCNGPGRVAVFSAMSPIVAASGPRKASLKTRTVKKELGPTWNRNVSSFESVVPEAVPLSRFRIEIHRHASLPDDHLSRVPLCPSALFSGSGDAEFPELLLKSKSSGSVK